MHDVFLVVAVVEVAIAAMLLGRVYLGPSIADRIVATNAMSTQIALGMLCFAVYDDDQNLLDVTIWVAAFSYLAAFVWARFAERGLL
jgi:multisubunit Na+/H+ antiporter MnhF subunit